MHHRLTVQGLLLVTIAVISPGRALWAAQQGSDPAAVEEVRQAVRAELDANRTDKSIWMYRESDVTSEKNAVYTTVETTQGTLRRLIELNGHPLSPQATANEKRRIQNYIHDSSALAKARKSSAHDDAQAEELLKMLPAAFIWTKGSESGDYDTLNFRPNPDFDPPDMQSRVMGIMEGQMVISKDGHRIVTLKGKLSDDVRIGWGILGKLYRGGTFDVERRLVGEHHWQITETHVHIGGHALIFKNIGQQEDDVKTEWKPSPAQTLDEAAALLTAAP